MNRHLQQLTAEPYKSPVNRWWDSGNDLALVKAMRKFAREQDGDWTGEIHSALNSGLIGVARQIGMNEDDIRDAFDSDSMLVIYEP